MLVRVFPTCFSRLPRADPMRRWRDYSLDPNAPLVLRRRALAIREARCQALIRDRVQYLCELAAGKYVLDVGVVDHTGDVSAGPDWLHGRLRESAERCVGIDIQEGGVRKLKQLGFDVMVFDMTKKPLRQTFDLIVAGEVLEHVGSPGAFMKNAVRMLAEDGRLVITTPNPWYLNIVVRKLLPGGSIFTESVDHVAWYDASVLYELGQRYGLKLVRFAGVGSSMPRTLKGKMVFGVRPLLIFAGLAPELFAKSIVYEFIKA